MRNGKVFPKVYDQIAHRVDPPCRVVAAGNQSYTAATLVSSLYVQLRLTWALLPSIPSVPSAPTGLDVVQSAYYSINIICSSPVARRHGSSSVAPVP
jgi:hypothetical protein